MNPLRLRVSDSNRVAIPRTFSVSKTKGRVPRKVDGVEDLVLVPSRESYSTLTQIVVSLLELSSRLFGNPCSSKDDEGFWGEQGYTETPGTGVERD